MVKSNDDYAKEIAIEMLKAIAIVDKKIKSKNDLKNLLFLNSLLKHGMEIIDTYQEIKEEDRKIILIDAAIICITKQQVDIPNKTLKKIESLCNQLLALIMTKN